MAGETQAPVAPEGAAEAVVAAPPASEPCVEKNVEPCEEKRERTAEEESEAGVAAEDKAPVIAQSASFKEESNVVANLTDQEKKALDELKELIAAALANNDFAWPLTNEGEKEPEKKEVDEVAVEEREKSRETNKDPESAPEPCELAEEERPDPAAVTEKKNVVGTGAETVVSASEVVKGEKRPEDAEEEKRMAKVVHVVGEEKKMLKVPEVVVEEEKQVPNVSDVVVEEEKTTEVAEKVVVEEEEKTTEVAEKVVVEEEKKITEVAEEVVVEEEKKMPKVAAEVVAEGQNEMPKAAEKVLMEEEKKPEEKDVGAAQVEEKLPPPPPEEVFVWGVPLLGSDKSDTILLKFLRARDYKVKHALTMIKNTVIWRKKFGIESLLKEDLGVPELEKAVFMHGVDKEGHPICYNVLGEFQDKELYQKTLVDDKGKIFLRWRIQFLEKGIQEMLDFSPEGVCTMVQVIDFKNAPWLWKKELRHATGEALDIFQENYPEFSVKQIFINVPWWYLPPIRLLGPFTQRTKSKFVFAGPSKSSETLLKYITPEQVPVKYGGLSMDDDSEFCTADAATVISIKQSTKHPIEIPVTETCWLVWEIRVLGWDVSYGAEFVPSEEGGYTVIIQKTRKLASTDEAVVRGGFKIGEPGKVILTVDNASFKKKKLIYRYKTKN